MNTAYTYKPLRFFLVTNLIMWASWLTVGYFSYQKSGGPKEVVAILELIGLFSPLCVALWMILTSNSGELKRNFYSKLFDLKSIRPWTIPAIFLILPGAIIISVVISRIFFNEPLSQLSMARTDPFVAGIIPAQLLLVLAPIIEEIGWKGYGLESLRGRRTFFKATIIFAALWALWHGPTFFVRDYYQNMLIRTNPLFALNFILSFFPFTVIANWLWYKNKGNILTAILCHAVIDFQGMIQMGQMAKCLETLVFTVIAVIVLVFNKKMFFENFSPQIGYFGSGKT